MRGTNVKINEGNKCKKKIFFQNFLKKKKEISKINIFTIKIYFY